MTHSGQNLKYLKTQQGSNLKISNTNIVSSKVQNIYNYLSYYNDYFSVQWPIE